MEITAAHLRRATRGTGVVIGALAAAVAVAAAFVREYSGDFHWHVTLGDWSREHAAIYRLDTLSFTYAGQPMFASAWLADVLLSLSYRTGGYPAGYVLRALCFLATLWIMAREGRQQKAPLVVTATFALCVFAEAWPQLYLRPEMFSFPCLAATLHLLGAHERTGRPGALLGGLALVALWGNLHGSLAIGMLAFGLYGAERAVRGAFARDGRRLAEGLALPVLVYLASCINAEGFRMAFAFLTLDGGCTDQNEWAALRMTMVRGPGALVLLGAVACLIAAVPRPSPWRALLFLAMVANTLQHRRFLLPTLFIAVFVVVAHAEPIGARARALISAPQVRGVSLLGLALVGVMMTVFDIRDTGLKRSLGLGEQPGVYPSAACAYVEKRGLGGRVINTYGIGGYLAFCLEGRAKVAIDQRACSLYPGDFYQAYKARLKTTAGMLATFDEMEADWAFVERGPAARALAGAPDRFGLVWVDDVVAVYVDRTRVAVTPDEVLSELEPERLVALARGEANLERAERELELQRARCPGCRTTVGAELAMAIARGDRRRFEELARRSPDVAAPLRSIAGARLGKPAP